MRDILKENWLFHYSNSQGIKGILDEGVFWATDANYLNDYKEIQLGISYANGWLEKNKTSIEQEVATKLKLNFNPNPGSQSGQRMFVCSFSTEKDSLSQWRAYGKGGGYAIGFHHEHLERKVTQLGLRMEKCVYKHDFENNPVEEYLTKLLNENFFENFNDKKLNIVCMGVMQKSIILKGEAFQEELEWRVFPNWDFGIEFQREQFFRIREGVFVPYVKFNLFPTNEEEKYIQTDKDSKCPVLRIMVGPTPHKTLASDGLRKMLRDNQTKYIFLSPEESKVSFRDW